MRGFNCTIFAYGQTGTGKTYTMSGDISDQLPLAAGAGIIPRVLHALFARLDSGLNSPATVSETDVKVSFIELYNEELRDLLAPDEGTKLKIYDGDGKKGHGASWIQGMEETHISSFPKGIELLQHGSYKRQVAATKCNDLSSRSHTVFTITVLRKSTSEGGEDYLSAGKLNLVDLAGSENIARSGAENKRAAEAGLINKSLLTLGRVINALVDRQQHIPYRESKLTRLLQDSLGGRTKTCIIATLSPAKSNLEETISTLDYAFRAKNIRNKPQISQISKKQVLKDLALEIEKLKSELIVTRQKNGVYLTQQAYDEMTSELESRRVQVKEQTEKIETVECNIQNKLQELHTLTTGFKNLKEDNELHRKTLEEEVYVRQQHERTEEQLAKIDRDLIQVADQLRIDVGGLHSKLNRKSDLHSTNRQVWTDAQVEVSQVTSLVDERLQTFQEEQQTLVEHLSSRMHKFIKDELAKITSSKAELEKTSESFDLALGQLSTQAIQAKDQLNSIVSTEITSLREEVKQKVGAGLEDLNKATQCISAGIMSEIESFHTQLHSSYATLGRDVKSTFDDILKEVSEQREQMEHLKSQMTEANRQLTSSNGASVAQFSSLVQSEKTLRETENDNLMTRIQDLLHATAKQQELRMQELAKIPQQFSSNTESHGTAMVSIATGQDELMERVKIFGERMNKSRDVMKSKLQGDFAVSCFCIVTLLTCQAANKYSENIKTVTSTVHEDTKRIVNSQLTHLDAELRTLDTIASRIQQQNNASHAARESSLTTLGSTAKASYTGIADGQAASFERVDALKADMCDAINNLQDTLPTLDADSQVRKPLSDLRERVEGQGLKEYTATGFTPAKKDYKYPHAFPRTESRQVLLERLRNRGSRPGSSDGLEDLVMLEEVSLPAELNLESALMSRSPSKTTVYADQRPSGEGVLSKRSGSNPSSETTQLGLREIDGNALNRPTEHAFSRSTNTKTVAVEFDKKRDDILPPLKRIHTTGSGRVTKAILGSKKRGARSTVAGNNHAVLLDRENLTMPLLSASVGAGTAHPLRAARRLRSHERNNTPT
jgi:kinesin family member 11